MELGNFTKFVDAALECGFVDACMALAPNQLKLLLRRFSLSFDLGPMACINPAAALCSSAEGGPGLGLNGSRRRRPRGRGGGGWLLQLAAV